jgi:hypothetical protein
MRLLYIALVAVLVGLFVKVLSALSQRTAILTPILGWIVGLAFFVLAPLTLIVLNGGYQAPAFYQVNDSHANVNLSAYDSLIPFLVIWFSLCLSLLAVLCFVPKTGSRKRSEVIVSDTALKKIVWITTCLAVVDYIVAIRTIGGLDQFLITNWYLRGADLATTLGDRYVLYLWLAQANQTVFTAAAVLFTHSQARKGVVNWRFTLLLIGIFLFHIAFQGERIYLALYLVSLLGSCLLYRRMKTIAALLILTPALALVFSAWAYFRNAPTEIATNMPTYVDADMGNRAVTVLMDAIDGSDTVFLFHIINDFGSKYRFLYGASYARALFFMVPRSLYPNKPTGFAIQLAEIYEPGETTSFAATQLGELYANFGPVSILLLPLLTVGILFFSEWLTRRISKHALTAAVVFLLLIWSARSTLEDNFITFLLAAALIQLCRFDRALGVQAGAPMAVPTQS